MLDEKEEAPVGRSRCMRLQYPLVYVLVSMNRTKAGGFDGLESGVLPVAPLIRTFAVVCANGK